MTEEELQRRYDEVDPVYTSIEQVPERYREGAKELISKGDIKVDDSGKIKVRESTVVGRIAGMRAEQSAMCFFMQKDGESNGNG